MKKISTVLIAMLLLTLSVLAAHADQEGNARWCNIDNDGCYLNEEGGVKSYMYFWTVESCKFFMGNDDPCKNVVARYDKDNYRLPLEPAPEPIVYQPKKLVKPLDEAQPDETLRVFFEETLDGRVKIVKGIVILTDGSTVSDTASFIPAAEAAKLSHSKEGDILLIPIVRYTEKEEGQIIIDVGSTADYMKLAYGSEEIPAVLDSTQNSVIVPALKEDTTEYVEYEVIGFALPEDIQINPEDADKLPDIQEITGEEPEYVKDDEGNVTAVVQEFNIQQEDTDTDIQDEKEDSDNQIIQIVVENAESGQTNRPGVRSGGNEDSSVSKYDGDDVNYYDPILSKLSNDIIVAARAMGNGGLLGRTSNSSGLQSGTITIQY